MSGLKTLYLFAIITALMYFVSCNHRIKHTDTSFQNTTSVVVNTTLNPSIYSNSISSVTSSIHSNNKITESTVVSSVKKSSSSSSKIINKTFSTSKTAPKPVIAKTLQNTYTKLNNDKKLKIGYIGGSVTVGTGSTNKDANSWRAKTTQWFKTQFPNATISEVDASNGGTGSGWGVFRIEKDLLSKSPDIIFIEFIINDCYERTAVEETKRNIESMYKRIYKANPYADIVMVYTTDLGFKGLNNPWIDANNYVANHYGVAAVDVGLALKQKIDAGDGVWSDYLVDYAHPNDRGYSVYSDAVCSYLNTSLITKSPPVGLKKHSVPNPLGTNLLLDTQIINASGISLNQSTNWSVINTSNWYEFDNLILSSTKENSSLVTSFEGFYLGLLLEQNTSAVATNIEITVDGNIVNENLSLYRTSANRTYMMICNNLSSGTHELTIKNVSGKRFNLAAVMVAK